MSSTSPFDFDELKLQAAAKLNVPIKKRPIRVEFPPIDVRLLTEQCLGNLAFGVSLLEAFATTTEERIAGFEAQGRLGNIAAVGEMALTLKGVVGVLGADTLLSNRLAKA